MKHLCTVHLVMHSGITKLIKIEVIVLYNASKVGYQQNYLLFISCQLYWIKITNCCSHIITHQSEEPLRLYFHFDRMEVASMSCPSTFSSFRLYNNWQTQLQWVKLTAAIPYAHYSGHTATIWPGPFNIQVCWIVLKTNEASIEIKTQFCQSII